MAQRELQTPDYTGAARELIAAGPEQTGRAPRSSLRGMARAGLLRLLKPYTAYQGMVDERLVAALERLQSIERIEPLVDHILDALEAIRARVQQAESSLQSLTAFRDSSQALPYMADSPFAVREEAVAGRVLGYVGGERVGQNAAYATFEDVFRGPESRVRELQRRYLDLLGDRQPVLDAGCGRGEFLDLLAERRIAAVGVDIDPGMVERCRAKGHAHVQQSDVNSYLAGLPDDHLGAVFSAQVIEHIPYPELQRFLELSLAKLKPAGLFIAETVNPHSPAALKNFWVDPTHQHPLFPEVTLALCRAAGYGSAYVFHPAGSGDVERDRYVATEYAVVATK